MQNKEHSDTKIVLIKFIALDLLELWNNLSRIDLPIWYYELI